MIGFSMEWHKRGARTVFLQVSKAAYDLLGFLPVLPGPCGLYRYVDLANATKRVATALCLLLNESRLLYV